MTDSALMEVSIIIGKTNIVRHHHDIRTLLYRKLLNINPNQWSSSLTFYDKKKINTSKVRCFHFVNENKNNIIDAIFYLDALQK